MPSINEERVLGVHHWNDSVFTLTTTRSPSFSFRPGHFVMIGLEVDGMPVLRAYSIVSAPDDHHLEFYSIKVPDGPLTSRLKDVTAGSTVLVGRKPTGTLVLETLRPGKRLYLLATGTGLAPFMSIVRDSRTYDAFEQVILVHGVRRVSDLGYRAYLQEQLPLHPRVGAAVVRQFRYYPAVTREPFCTSGRLTGLLESARITIDLGLPALDSEQDRVMLCGSADMLRDLSTILERRGFREASTRDPREYAVERSFAARLGHRPR
jgi:ferredoxin--NADP+ reductase